MILFSEAGLPWSNGSLKFRVWHLYWPFPSFWEGPSNFLICDFVFFFLKRSPKVMYISGSHWLSSLLSCNIWPLKRGSEGWGTMMPTEVLTPLVRSKGKQVIGGRGCELLRHYSKPAPRVNTDTLWENVKVMTPSLQSPGVWVWSGEHWEGAEMLPDSPQLCIATVSAGGHFPICLVRLRIKILSYLGSK